MPVPTDTFWNIRKLNIIFALAAVALLGSTVWLIMADWNRDWRVYQQKAVVWETAMTRDAAATALDQQQKKERDDLERQISQAKANLSRDNKLKELQAQLAAAKAAKASRDLPAATAKGQIGPLEQLIERATLESGPDSPQVREYRERLNKVRQGYDALAAEIASYSAQIAKTTDAIDKEQRRLDTAQKTLDNLTRVLKSKLEALGKLHPEGLAALGEQIRNAPLSDWFNPSLRPQQVVVPDVRTNYNFVTADTIDRCNSCHINIDNPQFEEGNLLLFAERQVAMGQGQDLDTINHPVVLLDFWVRAAKARAATPAGRDLVDAIKTATDSALQGVNDLRTKAGLKPLTSSDQLFGPTGEFGVIATITDKTRPGVTRKEWYQPLALYLGDLRKMLLANLGPDQFKDLRTLYRYALIDQYNLYRAKNKLPALDPNPVLLGHPDMGLYVDAESKHPMKTMGCTVCHDGSGQETDFVHSAHVPREVWVDEETGASIPNYLVGITGQIKALRHEMQPPEGHEARQASFLGPAAAEASVTPEPGAAGGAPDAPEAAAVTSVYSEYDVNLSSPKNPAPFAPDPGDTPPGALYHDPANTTDAAPRLAVRQEEYWTQRYHWQHIHYDIWETPMQSLDYIESSCAKCHGEVFDIRDEAPKLFEGRKLFAQLGCINCHAVDSVLKTAMDIKKVGPSLVHVHEKLSPEMMASWIWAPKAFRPMTRMPHFFMLENNSSPVDILRTRTEVAAITYYLQNTPPSPGTPTYTQERPPDAPGDVDHGRQLFKTVGCLACHTNMAEFGQQWIQDDLVKRLGLSTTEAEKRFKAMSYNQQHWYAMDHLQDKLVLIGPELSGVGTKLKTGRTLAQARGWVYDWVRNPRHYSSYTIMPRLRLSVQEANDLSAYLLSQERPDYKAQSFDLDEEGKRMLDKLVVALPDTTGKVTTASPFEDKLRHVGMKAIANYGCSGCHLINGFENAVSACTPLDDWGLKDPHKLDFGYFDHTFDQDREKPITIWKVAHEGLEPDAPQVTARSDQDHSPEIHRVSVKWETMDLERRPWAYNKLHNPRVYDRGRTIFDGHLAAGPDGIDFGRPYDRLKMPKFFLPDDQVQELVTFVTSIRKPLVSDRLLAQTYPPDRLRVAHGRQLATMYNCYGCHNIDGNFPHIQLYFDTHNSDGTWNFANMQNAPPRLIGQGSRTQPDWLFGFLQNVVPLRPWLTIRMPSFPLASDPDHVKGLVDFFAGNSQVLHDQLEEVLDPIDDFIQKNPGRDWFDLDNVVMSKAVEGLKSWAITLQFATDRDFDPRNNSVDDLRTRIQGSSDPKAPLGLYGQLKFLLELNTIQYPFPYQPAPDISDEEFARGEAFFKEVKCFQCHALGDEAKLLALWKLDNPNAGKAPPAPAQDDDSYEDSSSDAKKPAASAASSDEGYGDESAAAPAPAPPVGPVYRAPNLSYTWRRLQWNWVSHWFQEPGTIIPGTSMPQWFPHGRRFDGDYPPEVQKKLDSMYGYTGPDQMRLLMEFIYAAGARDYTPGAERLQGGKPAPQVQITPLAPPPQAATPAPASPAEGAGGTGTPGAAPAPAASPAPVSAAPPPAPKPQPAVSDIQLNDGSVPYHGTRIVGVVHVAGSPHRLRPIQMDADPFCAAAHPNGAANEALLINPDRTIRNVFVFVKEGLPAGRHFAVPEDMQHPQLAQQGCMYEPRVLGMVAGQRLTITNDDNTLHNVQVSPHDNPVFNEAMPVKGMTIEKAFPKAETTIMFKCAVHPWMTAFIHVMPDPFFGVSDVQGRFEIKGLPPGKYTLEAIHEDGKMIPPVDFDVTVSDGQSQRADVTLQAAGH